MIYTAIIQNNTWITHKTFDSSHSANDAWNEIQSMIEKDGARLIVLVPGMHEIITSCGRSNRDFSHRHSRSDFSIP